MQIGTNLRDCELPTSRRQSRPLDVNPMTIRWIRLSAINTLNIIDNFELGDDVSKCNDIVLDVN